MGRAEEPTASVENDPFATSRVAFCYGAPLRYADILDRFLGTSRCVWQFSTTSIMPMRERLVSAGSVSGPRCRSLPSHSENRPRSPTSTPSSRTGSGRASHAHFFEQLPNLRIIAQTGNHVYHIDLEATEERGIIVAKATGGGCTSAAELAIGLMIAVMRQIPAVDTQVKRGGWPTPMTRVLRGKTLGIVGLGYVGRHVSKIANAFEMKVLAWGPRLTAQAAASVGAESCELDALMARSDIVSIHATLSPDSRGLIDARRLGLMRSSAYLINTARGPIIEEAAVAGPVAATPNSARSKYSLSGKLLELLK